MESKMRVKERKQSNPIEHVILPSSVVSVFDVLVVGHVCGPQDQGSFVLLRSLLAHPKKKRSRMLFFCHKEEFQLNKSLFPRILLKTHCMNSFKNT
jgi:tRNA U34 2-thiouridine synthase MnmA/TrmU